MISRKNRHSGIVALTALSLGLTVGLFVCSHASADQTDYKFSFGSGLPKQGYTQVAPTAVYSKEAGFGFEPGAAVKADQTSVTSDQPFSFSVALPEGNYTVTATFGDPTTASQTTVKAEARRLMLEKVDTVAGKFETRTFTVNIRTPKISTGGQVSINKREMGPPLVMHWDEKLTLEFNNSHPALASLDIAKNDKAITVFLAGDSTVTDQAHEPWNGWGQMLPRFFKPDVAIANQAESGLALPSFKAQHRLEKIMSVIKPGDYVFIQFGHNDQKIKTPGAGAFTTYKDDLEFYVAETRKHGGIPVLVTPMNRRSFDGNKLKPTLGDFPEAVRQAAKDKNVPLIDLNAMSTEFYEAMGPENSTMAFVHYPANTFPGQAKALADNTHFNAYGGYELAKCIVEGIKAQLPELAKYLLPEAQVKFDPAHPDAVANFHIPPSLSTVEIEKPAGN